jgi:hypothetical protein
LHKICTNQTSTNLPTSTPTTTTKPTELQKPNKLQQRQPTKMVPNKPIGLPEMIENCGHEEGKGRNAAAPDCYPSDTFGQRLTGLKRKKIN